MRSQRIKLILFLSLFVSIQSVLGSQNVANAADVPIPSESECRPYIEKALKEKDHPEASTTEPPTSENSIEDDNKSNEGGEVEGATEGGGQSEEGNESNTSVEETAKPEDLKAETDSIESKEVEEKIQSVEQNDQEASVEEEIEAESVEEVKSVEDEKASVEQADDDKKSEDDVKSVEETKEVIDEEESKEEQKEEKEKPKDKIQAKEESKEKEIPKVKEEEVKEKEIPKPKEEVKEKEIVKETVKPTTEDKKEVEENKEEKESGDSSDEEDKNSPEEEDLTLDIIIPDNLRDKKHVKDILKLDEDTKEEEDLLVKTIDTTLKELKRLYDNTIKPLELLYKYRDLSNRHFSDPEIFSKPLVLFMGPWSGGKSSIINYLLDNEYSQNSLRTGAEPSPAYFNILSWGESPTVLDGTQLAADWTFSGLQKFGQGLLDRLRGLQLPHPLLEKINIVEIPGILEIRKQVERQFPFNDACQWFIDRADIIFLVYDPSKLDVGPETEAILDQLKGREYQTRIILNKADQVKPEELMRVQGTLIWNISPLMSSSEPPIMYSTSLWSNPYEIGAPIRLLQAQETAFLRDLRHAIDKRVENKIASARRFAVRVRNHAKMVDCYLTTYYNHKTFFGNRKKIADDIIEHPQNYHIYAGLSTLTNISRYDLPDPEVYRDFFRLNPVFEFKKLSDTCTYFRGCPINRLDVTIAYDLPELVGKFKKSTEHILKDHASKKQKVDTKTKS